MWMIGLYKSQHFIIYILKKSYHIYNQLIHIYMLKFIENLSKIYRNEKLKRKKTLLSKQIYNLRSNYQKNLLKIQLSF